jgi:2-polyprenyl-3-methyl-5-hydroxy-6-metoxy-1,4-benzoquinol methylase
MNSDQLSAISAGAELEFPWTGERLVPSHKGDTALEHLHRYAFAREYVRGKQILDIACGEGYGSKILAGTASRVVGVDICQEVILHASRKYGDGDRLEFKVGSCTSIPLPDNSVDGVVSFETLEHLAEHEEMLGEVKRVLRPGGFIILSTPDKLHCTIIPKNHNPFHVLELTREEFSDLLHKTFSHVYLFEQRICHCSLLAPTADLPISGIRDYRGDFRRLSWTDGIAAPLFNLAIAADGECEFKHVVSLFHGRDIPTELEKRFSELGDELKTTQHELDNTKKTVRSLTEELHATRQELDNAQRKVRDATDDLNATQKTIQALTNELNATQQEFARLRYRFVRKAGRHLDRMPLLPGLLRWAARIAAQ